MAKSMQQKSPRSDFFPIRLQIENKSQRKAVTLVLFNENFKIPETVSIRADNPRLVPYLLLCSFVKRVRMRVNRTQMELLDGKEEQLSQPIHLIDQRRENPRASEEVKFDEVRRFAPAKHIVHTTEVYQFGGGLRLPQIVVQPGTRLNLSFFVPEGEIPSLKTTTSYGRKDRIAVSES